MAWGRVAPRRCSWPGYPGEVKRICGFLAVAVLGVLPVPPVGADDVPSEPDAESFLASIEEDPGLQAFLDAKIAELQVGDTRLRQQVIRAAVLDVPVAGVPRLAHHNGASPVYPASVPKFVYLMAAYAWRDAGRLEFDAAFDRQLEAMIHRSSNRATQVVVRRLTATEAGPRLDEAEYREFVRGRHAVKYWLQDMGIEDLHTVHPTYDGGGDLHGRDLQFLEDKTIEGCLPNQTTGPYFNRQAMTANGSAKLLALLGEHLALSVASSAEVKERMRRDPRQQPYLWKRIAGGLDPRDPDFEVFSKTGTWGPIYADAGIVRHASGHQLVVVVFLEGNPAYRGPFIAKLTRAAVAEILIPAAAASGRSRSPGLPGAARD